jgi:hypothetical protein
MPTFDRSSAWGRAKAKAYKDAEARAKRDKNLLIPGLRIRHDGWREVRTVRRTGCSDANPTLPRQVMGVVGLAEMPGGGNGLVRRD